MVDFRTFDTRGYRTVDVRNGYGEWAATYEQTVEDAMDVELLDTLRAVQWEAVDRAADLSCGTGRIGAWLRANGVSSVDGVDLTPAHFDSASGEPLAIETHVHPLSEHVTAGLAAGWTLAELKERLIDDTWLALKPNWEPLRSRPISFAFVWRKDGPAA